MLASTSSSVCSLRSLKNNLNFISFDPTPSASSVDTSFFFLPKLEPFLKAASPLAAFFAPEPPPLLLGEGDTGLAPPLLLSGVPALLGEVDVVEAASDLTESFLAVPAKPFILFARSIFVFPTILKAVGNPLLETPPPASCFLGVEALDSTSLSSSIVFVVGTIEDRLEDGFERDPLASGFFLSMSCFTLCIIPINLVGVGAGSRFMKAVARLPETSSLGLGEGLGIFLFAFVTTTSGFFCSVLSRLARVPKGFSVCEGPGDPALLTPNSITDDFKLDRRLRS